MTENDCKLLKEKYYTFKHKTGLDVCVLTKSGHSKIYALFATNFGSVDIVCNPIDGSQTINVPDGTAHFLEHKLFENENEDAFERYARTGANANAFTSFDKTAYLFSCTDHFEQSFEILVDLVQNPYFTEQTVKKEQGIIGQEIKMYEDDPDWRVFFNLLTALFVKNPVNIDPAGTVGTIAQITPELLYKCYNTFYNPANMVLIICGDVSPQSVEELCDKYLIERPNTKIKRSLVDEPEEVAQKEITISLPVSQPMFLLGYKDTSRTVGLDAVKNAAVTEILLEIICGQSSGLYSKLYSEGLINAEFRTEYMYGDTFGATIIGGQSTDPQKVVASIAEKIVFLSQNGISKDDLERIKKMIYGRTLRQFNSVEDTARIYLELKFIGVSLSDYINAYSSVTLEDCLMRLNSHFIDQHSSVSIVLPTKEKK